MVMPSLATTDDFTTWTGLAVTDEDYISALLLRASSALRSATGQIISRVENDVLTVPWGGEFLLPQRPADRPTSITVNGQTLTGWTVVGQRLAGLAWESWWGAASFPMVVTYSHGFATVPDEIVAIVCDAAARTADNPDNVRQVGNVTFGTETIGGVTLTADEIRRARFVLGVPSVASMSLL